MISELLDYVDTFTDRTSREQTARIGYRIATLKKQLTRQFVTQQLQPFGLERYAPTILTFKVKTGALSEIAIKGDPARVLPYLNGSGYQRSLRATQDVVFQVCDTSGGTDPSDAATWEISVFSGGGTLSRLTSISVPIVAGAGLALVFGLFGVLRLKGKRNAKEARINKRTSCDIPVIATTQSGGHFLRVVDISRGGVNIAGARDWQVGDSIDVDFGPISRKAIIRWKNDHFSGIQFDEALSADEQSTLIADYCELTRPRIKKRGNLEGAAPKSFAARRQSAG